MEIKFIEFELQFDSQSKYLNNLRSIVLSRLKEYGDPLRWAITDLIKEPSLHCQGDTLTQVMRVEGVVLITELPSCENKALEY